MSGFAVLSVARVIGMESCCTRVAPCPPLLSSSQQLYRIYFPFGRETQGVAYETDKEKRRLHQDSDDVESLVKAFELDLKLDKDEEPPIFFDSGTELTAIHFDGDEGQHESIRSIEVALSNCISGRIPAVLQFLDTSKDSQLLIIGRDHRGKTALSLAAPEKISKMVSLLLERGADVNTRDDEGRSPLMEAALWGRAENVEVLLRYNPEKASKDRSGYTALDFAAPHVRDSKERSRRTAERSREDTYEADKQRRVIVRMLEDQPAKSSISFAPPNHQDDDISCCSFKKSAQTSSIKFCAPNANIPVTWHSKTVGRLDRGHPFQHTYAMSGWTHKGEDLDVIRGERWTEEELEITVRNPDVLVLAGAPGETTEVGLHSPERGRDLRDLYLARPPVEMRRATILVSSTVCDNCRDFVKKVEMSYGLTIRVKHS